MADDLQTAYDAAEDDTAAVVADVLAAVAAEFAAALDEADEIVAARFSVSRIVRMWTSRIPQIMRRLLRVAETAANGAADSVDAQLPAEWEDLSGRYDDGVPMPRSLGSYVENTEHLLRAVGDRLSAVALAELAEGLDAGEDMDQLRARLRRAFARSGAQLGATREDRVARTEANRAWNTATLAAGRDLTGPDRPLVKQWLTRHDNAVRAAHKNVDGQLQLIDEPFNVGGVRMDHPGDPTAPPSLTVNCRCRLALAPAPRPAAVEPQAAVRPGVFKSKENPVHRDTVTADASGSHLQGAMIALVPTEEDAQRLAVEGGEDPDELHLTLYYLGSDGEAWTEDQRNELIAGVRSRAASMLAGPVTGMAFGANLWNADSDSPSWVWSVGDDRDRPDDAPTLADAHTLALDALESTHERPEVPAQHSPWVAHVCAAYSDDPGLLPELTARLGPITFDRIRVTFAGDRTDIPLRPEDDMNTVTAADITTRTWSTPGDAALAFENTETGDGRIFTTGALTWDGPGPWPLQYADEMLMGHEGAELAGAIDTIGRDGDRITGTGVLYVTRPAGADAAMLLDEGAPLGVSVDLDDVDLEFVDRTLDGDEDDDWLFATAHLARAQVMRLNDGSAVVTASTPTLWAASEGGTLVRSRTDLQLVTGPGGRITAAALHAAFAGTAVLKAAAGDPDDPDTGMVIHQQKSGDLLLRITRARLRGATLVSMPAYDRARIVLDPVDETAQQQAAEDFALAASAVAAGGAGEDQQRVVTYVSASPVPVGARQVAKALGMAMAVARMHLVNASRSGRLVRLGPGQYVGSSTLPEGPTAVADDDGPVDMETLEASAWSEMQDMDPLPAAWFAEPTPEELPPGSGGVHYAAGRIFGWVAQAGVPHAGYPGRNLTIESLGAIDTTHFLRARFPLDDGTFARVGAFTMNVGHHRDGAECETDACQFDDTRTVAGIVTVGMNARGMWFSGAAAPWLSEWDRAVFAACQPSYHMQQGADGRWQLRAVLSVPVPGHSSPFLASAVATRSNLALAAAAVSTTAPLAAVSGQRPDNPSPLSGQRPDTARQLSGHAARTASDLAGHCPDTTAAVSGQRPDTTAYIAPLGDLSAAQPLTFDMIARRSLVDELSAIVFGTPEPATAKGRN